MCGIAGFWGDVAGRPDASELLERITSSLNHRGPDGTSYWLGANVGLGHTRLAIIDLESGDQPMWSRDRRKVIVFNGEIYNYRELRSELETCGHIFITQSDTEVIAAAVSEWGISRGLLRLRGMFAFALYDIEKRTLLLARDRVGIKPLYWLHKNESLVFGSEPKAILSSGLASLRINPVAIHDYLGQGYAVTPSTCWTDINLLEPGTWLEIGPQGIKSGCYWTWKPREDSEMELNEATETAEKALSDSLKSHLVSDVEVGAFLSGGLDSSLAVAMLSRGPAPGIKTFCMGFGDSTHDESQYARQVATFCETSHKEAKMANDDADPDLLTRILNQYDEPFGDSSCVPSYLVCQEMRTHVKVVLSGDGGDEVLGGYPRYLLARRLQSLSRLPAIAALTGATLGLFERRFGRRGYQVAKAWRVSHLPRPAMLCSLHTYFSEEERSHLYNGTFVDLAMADGPTWTRFASLIPEGVSDPTQQLIAAEMRLHLHADYLKKVDIASSAHGLEVRVPYLDNSMLDLAALLPMRCKIGRRGETKPISRRLAQRYLPPEIATRRKQGFALPLDRWIGPEARSFLRSLLLDPQSRMNQFFEQRALRNTWNEFNDVRSGGGLSRFQRYQRVFLLASLELWLRRWNAAV